REAQVVARAERAQGVREGDVIPGEAGPLVGVGVPRRRAHRMLPEAEPHRDACGPTQPLEDLRQRGALDLQRDARVLRPRRRRVGVQQEAEIAGAEGTKRAPDAVRKFSSLCDHEPVFRAHAQNPALLDMVEDLIGTPIRLYADQALLKPPLVGSEKLPHQDNAYFRVAPDDAVITCWCALDDATIENGCMHYLPGSHRLGIVEHDAIAGT